MKCHQRREEKLAQRKPEKEELDESQAKEVFGMRLKNSLESHKQKR